MPGFAPSVIGGLAAALSMASFAPQLVKLIRERDAEAVSLRAYAVTVTGFICWVGYGLMTRSWPVVVSNGVCLVLSAAILVVKCRLSTGKAGR